MAGRVAQFGGVVAVAVLLAPGAAVAVPQPDLALAATLGASVPLDAAIAFDVRLAGPTGSSDGTAGRPVIVDHEAANGVRFGLSLQLQQAAVEYALRRYDWAETRGLCEGEGGATVLSNGQVDDVGVTYDCDGTTSDFRIAGATSSNLSEHTLTVMLRHPLFDLDWAAGYAIYGGGLGMRTSAIATTQTSLNLGLIGEAGALLELPLDERFTLQIDGRIGGGLFTAAGTSGRAGRARAMGATSYGALVDDLLRTDFMATVRYTLE